MERTVFAVWAGSVQLAVIAINKTGTGDALISIANSADEAGIWCVFKGDRKAFDAWKREYPDARIVGRP